MLTVSASFADGYAYTLVATGLAGGQAWHTDHGLLLLLEDAHDLVERALQLALVVRFVEG